jgi:hypothetical protein
LEKGIEKVWKGDRGERKEGEEEGGEREGGYLFWK